VTRGRRALVAAVATAAVAVCAPSAAQGAQCAKDDARGGEWRSYSGDDSNTRFQAREKLISTGDAPLLSPAWTFSTVDDGGGSGDITGTPIVADGCVYTATNRGWVFAMNADTGDLVWKAQVPRKGTVNSSPAVTDRPCGVETKKVRWKKVKSKKRGKNGKPKRKWKYRTIRTVKRCGAVFVAVTRTSKQEGCPAGDPCIGPYVAAFDQDSGKVAWSTASLDQQPGADTYASPVLFDDVLMTGVSGGSAELGDDESERYAFQGSALFLDTTDGRLLRKTYTIHPPNEPADEFAGGAIWSTPAIDRKAKAAYVGSGNPFNPSEEHEHTNAVLRFDLDKNSKTFGQITGSYKGNIDEYIPFLSELPCFDFVGNNPPYYPQGAGSCGDIDLDFGSAPNLFRGEDGRKLVGAGQKSGVYHVFDAETMEPVWNQIVGPPTPLGGIVGSTAVDGDSVYGPITVPGYAWALNARGGAHKWFAPIFDGAHWGPPTSVANGVVYSVDLTGFLNAFDARTGVLLAKRPMALGSNGAAKLSWGGVSIARNTIYAGVGMTGLPEGFIVAYKPGGVSDVPADAQETATGAGGGGGGDEGGDDGGEGAFGGGAVVAVPGSTYSTYATPVMVTSVGGPLSFANFDLPQHDVVSVAKAPDGRALFQSRLAGVGEVAPVEGLDRVKSGSTYEFFCSLHPGMRGNLLVR
jgi:polyvinyl alcohol dehydrogenase (cytochrome)